MATDYKMNNVNKYTKQFFPAPVGDVKWIEKNYIEKSIEDSKHRYNICMDELSKKINDKKVRVAFKLEKGLKLTKKEKALAQKMEEEKLEQAKKEEEAKAKASEPTFEERQLSLLQGIYDSLNTKTAAKKTAKKEQ